MSSEHDLPRSKCPAFISMTPTICMHSEPLNQRMWDKLTNFHVSTGLTYLLLFICIPLQMKAIVQKLTKTDSISMM